MIVRIPYNLSLRKSGVARRLHKLSLAPQARGCLAINDPASRTLRSRGEGWDASQNEGRGCNRGLRHQHPGNLNLERLTLPAVGPATIPQNESQTLNRGASTGVRQGFIAKERSPPWCALLRDAAAAGRS
jgi:hypothetical protein